MAETSQDKEKAPPPPPQPESDPTLGVMAEMVSTLRAIRERADRDADRSRPALPAPGLFEAGKGYHVIDSAGRRARHDEGRAIFLDDKLRPIPAE